MTFPPEMRDVTEGWRPGERVGRSWLLLAGVVPVDYDDVVFEEIGPGLEAKSSPASQTGEPPKSSRR